MQKISRRQFLKLGLTGCVFVLSYPVVIERYLIQVNTYRIPVPNLPAVFEGFRLLQISDIHYGFLVPSLLVESVVDTANRLNADAIICTGDYVHEKNSTRQIDEVWPIIATLDAPYGVFSVLGNHDHWADEKRSLFWLKESGQDLRHKSVSISKNNQKIWLGGAGDLWEDELGVDKAFENSPAEDCKILLAHNPDTVDHQFKNRIDLTISGHTHGGQVHIPFLGFTILPVKNKRYVNGFYKTTNGNLFISRGIGWTIAPVRFNCAPEIAILELVQEI